MITLDKKKMISNLLALEEDTQGPDDNILRTLLLVLAGDMRIIEQLSLTDMSNLFTDAADIIRNYEASSMKCLDMSQLKDVRSIRRRAL